MKVCQPYSCDRLCGPCLHQVTLPRYKNIFVLKNELLENKKGFWTFEIMECVIDSANQGLTCWFSNKGEKNSIGHFKEIEIGFINMYVLRIGSNKGRTNGVSLK